MTIEEIRELIRVVQETGVAELEVQRGDNRVRIRSAVTVQTEISAAALNMPPSPPPEVPSGPSSATFAPSEMGLRQLPLASTENGTEIVKSPIVGTYYDSPAPGEASFVKVGDRVEPKQVLCIIESMKLMNEIEAEVAGIITAKHVENGRPVEYGEVLFTISPR